MFNFNITNKACKRALISFYFNFHLVRKHSTLTFYGICPLPIKTLLRKWNIKYNKLLINHTTILKKVNNIHVPLTNIGCWFRPKADIPFPFLQHLFFRLKRQTHKSAKIIPGNASNWRCTGNTVLILYSSNKSVCICSQIKFAFCCTLL